jgi:hypothetical protein
MQDDAGAQGESKAPIVIFPGPALSESRDGLSLDANLRKPLEAETRGELSYSDVRPPTGALR